jgi:hypothetical protein
MVLLIPLGIRADSSISFSGGKEEMIGGFKNESRRLCVKNAIILDDLEK